MGGSGWFGRTALAMLGLRASETLVIGSFERTISVQDRDIPIQAWNVDLVEQYQPDVVLDFAFLTREFESSLGAEHYSATNQMLINRLVDLSRLASVKKILTISSGATVISKAGVGSSNLDLYGQQKLAAQESLRESARRCETEVAVARAWSVSGGHVQKYGNYAFSDMIHSAVHTGSIQVKAPHLVARRYCSVEDLLAVVIRNSLEKEWIAIDSGGPLVEMAELAQAIAQEVQGSKVVRSVLKRDSDKTDAYHSDNSSWLSACEFAGFAPLSLLEQIRNVREALS